MTDRAIAEAVEGRLSGAIKQAFGDTLSESECERLGAVAADAVAADCERYNSDVRESLTE